MKLFLRQVKALVKLSFIELWRRNDIFALVLLGLALMVPLSMATPFGAGGASRYLDEMALLLLVGKYIGAVAASWSALAFFYVLFVASVLVRGGGFSSELPQAIALHFAFVALAVAVSLLGSLIVTASANLSLSAIVLVGMFFFGRRLPEYAEGLNPALAWVVKTIYAIAPHAEFFDMRQRLIHGWGAVDGSVFVVVLAYAVVYVAILLSLASFALGRKRL